MKIDFHTHVKLTTPVPYSQPYAEAMLRGAKAAGLDTICVTEHYNSSGLDSVYRFLEDSCGKDGDCYIFEGLRIFPGIEVDIAESGHILTIGPLDEIMQVHKELCERGRKKEHPPFAALLEIIKRPSLLIGGAHPFRPETGSLLNLSDEWVSQLDYVELSGRDIAYDKKGIENNTAQLAARVGLPIIAGSDSHYPFQYGCVFNKFQAAHTTVAALKKAIAAGAYTVEYSEFGARQVAMAAQMKKALLKIHELGGDYAWLCKGE